MSIYEQILRDAQSATETHDARHVASARRHFDSLWDRDKQLRLGLSGERVQAMRQQAEAMCSPTWWRDPLLWHEPSLTEDAWWTGVERRVIRSLQYQSWSGVWQDDQDWVEVRVATQSCGHCGQVLPVFDFFEDPDTGVLSRICKHCAAQQKQCDPVRGCGLVLPLTDFRPNRGVCRSCEAAQERVRRNQKRAA